MEELLKEILSQINLKVWEHRNSYFIFLCVHIGSAVSAVRLQ